MLKIRRKHIHKKRAATKRFKMLLKVPPPYVAPKTLLEFVQTDLAPYLDRLIANNYRPILISLNCGVENIGFVMSIVSIDYRDMCMVSVNFKEVNGKAAFIQYGREQAPRDWMYAGSSYPVVGMSSGFPSTWVNTYVIPNLVPAHGFIQYDSYYGKPNYKSRTTFGRTDQTGSYVYDSVSEYY